MIIHFYKMQALGNDFVVIDNTQNNINISVKQIQFICNRKLGIGCDQLIVIKEIRPSEIIKMNIFNSDGSEANACGNATRCVGLHAMNKYKTKKINIKTDNRELIVMKGTNNNIIANMGKANFEPTSIPLFYTTSNILSFKDIGFDKIGIAVNVGNPHVVFIVDNIDDINLNDIGPKIENHKFFPNKVNVEIIKIIDNNTIKMRVWERGTGITMSCGTGATASFAVAKKLNLLNNEEKITVLLDGGTLFVNNDKENNIILEGLASLVFEGKIEL